MFAFESAIRRWCSSPREIEKYFGSRFQKVARGDARQRWDIKIVLKSRSSWRVFTVWGLERRIEKSYRGRRRKFHPLFHDPPRQNPEDASADEIGCIPSSDFPFRHPRQSSHLRKLPRISRSPAVSREGRWLFFSLLRALFVNNISAEVRRALFLTVEFPAKEMRQSLIIKFRRRLERLVTRMFFTPT